MRIASLSLLALGLTANAFAQTANNSIPVNVRATNTLEQLRDGGLTNSEILYGIPMAPGDVVGDTFIKDEWQKSIVTLKDSDKQIKGFNCKYNILNKEVHFQTRNGEIRALSDSKIKTLELVDPHTETVSYFVSATRYLHDGLPMDGLLEVLVEAGKPLFKRTEIDIIKPSYRVEFDMGKKETRLVKKHSYYTTDGVNLVKLNVNNKKKLLKSLKPDGKTSVYISSPEFKPENEIHLVHLFEFLNK